MVCKTITRGFESRPHLPKRLCVARAFGSSADAADLVAVSDQQVESGVEVVVVESFSHRLKLRSEAA